MKKIQLVSSDVNGTLVHQHTMMDMIRHVCDVCGRISTALQMISMILLFVQNKGVTWNISSKQKRI
ncbi:MAG: hypothetical protein HC887_06105 [Desulfobacteraceae bacterium]|nr:hypothetical protein [Desulfobacteraceae bacterium]